MAKRLEEDEKARIAKQKETLGVEGLKKVEEDLKAAKEEHDKEIPVEILKSFPVPSVKSISWIPVQSLQEVGSSAGRRTTVEQKDNDELARYIQADGSPLPFFVQYDHVEVSLPTRCSACYRGSSRIFSPTSSRSARISQWPHCPTSFARAY